MSAYRSSRQLVWSQPALAADDLVKRRADATYANERYLARVEKLIANHAREINAKAGRQAVDLLDARLMLLHCIPS